MEGFTEEHHRRFLRDGFVRLGTIPPSQLSALRRRLNQLMLGGVSHRGMRFALDESVDIATVDAAKLERQLVPVRTLIASDSVPVARSTAGVVKPTLSHRRIDDLERDPLFRDFIRGSAALREASRRVYQEADVALFRAMLINKCERGGQVVPFHQVCVQPHPPCQQQPLSSPSRCNNGPAVGCRTSVRRRAGGGSTPSPASWPGSPSMRPPLPAAASK